MSPCACPLSRWGEGRRLLPHAVTHCCSLGFAEIASGSKDLGKDKRSASSQLVPHFTCNWHELPGSRYLRLREEVCRRLMIVIDK